MLLVANWKANKNLTESLTWIDEINIQNNLHQIVIAAPFPFLEPIKTKISRDNKKIRLAAQTVSDFTNGQYTGEVTAQMLQGLADYCLVGHSERRRNFQETTINIQNKCLRLEEVGIKPIICANNETEMPEVVKNGKLNDFVLTFEPEEAISLNGIYKDFPPETAAQTITDWKSKLNLSCPVLYGGSVNLNNLVGFAENPEIDGLLIGHASLSASEFTNLLNLLTR